MAWLRTKPNERRPQTGTNSWTRYARDDLYRLFADPSGGRDRERMVDAINRLPERHRRVLCLMLGMDGKGLKPSSQIARSMPVTAIHHPARSRARQGLPTHLGRELVRQLEVEALKMLREAGAL